MQHFSTVEPIHTFMQRLPPLTNNLGVASDGDVYSTYSQLHSKGRNPQLLVSQSGGFYYFLADAPQEAETGNLVSAALSICKGPDAATPSEFLHLHTILAG